MKVLIRQLSPDCQLVAVNTVKSESSIKTWDVLMAVPADDFSMHVGTWVCSEPAVLDRLHNLVEWGQSCPPSTS